jgi:hypothetical protein
MTAQQAVEVKLFCSTAIAARHINDLADFDRVIQVTAKQARLCPG